MAYVALIGRPTYPCSGEVGTEGATPNKRKTDCSTYLIQRCLWTTLTQGYSGLQIGAPALVIDEISMPEPHPMAACR